MKKFSMRYTMKKSIEDLSSMLNVPSITSGKLQVASRMNREYIEVSNDLKKVAIEAATDAGTNR